MWFLNTERAELRFIVSPEDVPGGYAILSHVWDDTEQTFQELRRVCEECAATGANPRDFVSAKIREFCKTAKYHGFDWAWIDVCCIDKTSSADLSEAINSMFHYYSSAKVCFVYLRDVPSDDPLRSNSLFGASRWHRRGWTLQELVAPSFLVFLSKDWEVLGTKFDLASELEKITNVPAAVLRLEVKLTEISVARRMSWAARRETTRPEDRAYCLLGIFSINMPTLYGEGRQAFRRLQEEIMKKSFDTSLFAWRAGNSDAPLLSELRSDTVPFTHDHDKQELYLLAPSPSYFASCTDLSFTPLRSFALPEPPITANAAEPSDSEYTHSRTTAIASAAQTVGIPTFSTTSYGILADIPVFEAFGVMIAILFCSQSRNGHMLQVALILTPCDDAADSLRPLYHSGAHIPIRGETVTHRIFRTVLLEDGDLTSLQFSHGRFTAKWRKLHIVDWLQSTPSTTLPQIPINLTLRSPFRFPETAMRRLFVKGLHLDAVQATEPPWDGTPPAVFTFKMKAPGDPDRHSLILTIQLGCCTSISSPPAPPHWATVDLQLKQDHGTEQLPASGQTGLLTRMEDAGSNHTHSCPTDHICEWPNQRRAFSTSITHKPFSAFEIVHSCNIMLSFTRSTLSPSHCLVVDILEFELKYTFRDQLVASAGGLRPDSMLHLKEEAVTEILSDTDNETAAMMRLSLSTSPRPTIRDRFTDPLEDAIPPPVFPRISPENPHGTDSPMQVVPASPQLSSSLVQGVPSDTPSGSLPPPFHFGADSTPAEGPSSGSLPRYDGPTSTHDFTHIGGVPSSYDGGSKPLPNNALGLLQHSAVADRQSRDSDYGTFDHRMFTSSGVNSLTAHNFQEGSNLSSSAPPASHASSSPLPSISHVRVSNATSATDLQTFIRPYLDQYVRTPNRLGFGERTVIVMSSKVAQKSYGTEKRFLCPPPMAILIGNSWWSDVALPREGPKLCPPRVVIAIAGSPAPQESSVEWTSAVGKIFDVGDPPTVGTTYIGRCVGKHLFISDRDDQKKKNVEALVTITAPSSNDEPERIFGTFPSRPIKVIATPRKRQSTKNLEHCINHGSTVSLFHRLPRSPAVSTKYLCVSNSGSSFKGSDGAPLVGLDQHSTKTTPSFTARAACWDPFIIYIVNIDQPPVSVDSPPPPPPQPGYPSPPPNAIPFTNNGSRVPVYYNQTVVLQCLTSGVVSPVLIIRKVDHQTTVVGGGLVEGAKGVAAHYCAPGEVCGDPVFQLHRIAFEVYDPAKGAPEPGTTGSSGAFLSCMGEKVNTYRPVEGRQWYSARAMHGAETPDSTPGSPSIATTPASSTGEFGFGSYFDLSNDGGRVRKSRRSSGNSLTMSRPVSRSGRTRSMSAGSSRSSSRLGRSDTEFSGARWQIDVGPISVWTVAGTEQVRYDFYVPPVLFDNQNVSSRSFPVPSRPVTPLPAVFKYLPPVNPSSSRASKLLTIYGENFDKATPVMVFFGSDPSPYVEIRYTEILGCLPPEGTVTKRRPIILVRSDGIVYPTGILYP